MRHYQRARWVMAAVAMSLCGANFVSAESKRSKLQTNAAYQYEDFSFTKDGMNGMVQCLLELPERALYSLRQETLRRFEKTETQTGLGGQWFLSKKNWVGIDVLYSPRFRGDENKVLPQWSPSLGYGLRPFKNLIFETRYKYADYDTAKSHAFSLSSEWYAFARFYIIGRASAVGTDFPSVSVWVWKPSYFVQPVYDIVSERLSLLFIYAYSEEPFEAGAPGNTLSFSANIFHAGMILKVGKLALRGGWEYEDRSTKTFVRRTNASLSYSW